MISDFNLRHFKAWRSYLSYWSEGKADERSVMYLLRERINRALSTVEKKDAEPC
jgi:hypothetical protein